MENPEGIAASAAIPGQYSWTGLIEGLIGILQLKNAIETEHLAAEVATVLTDKMYACNLQPLV